MIVAIVNHKGGTGKTTTTVNLGAALTQLGKKILLVDLDAQGNLTYSLGIAEFDLSMAEVFLGETKLGSIIRQAEGMDVAPSDVRLADIELSLAEAEERESWLKEHLNIETQYDFVLVDCPPSLSLLTLNALNAADRVLVPMQMEVLSLQGLDLITTTINKVKNAFNPGLEIIGILPVMVDKRRKLSTEVLDHIRENYHYPVFSTHIRTNVKASEAPSFGQSVLTYDRESNSAKDYQALAKEFLQLTEN